MLGLSIGNYQVAAKVGEGGMGIVYRAVHATLGRSAAVKVLLPEFSHNREIVTRFFNEARAATAIRHPGIVEIYDFGFLPDQSAYIIMEFLEGESLASRLRREGVMQPARALQVVRAVARALHAAHEQGIVHRDLKPDNIFLVPDPEMPSGERVKLLDFGIAKLSSETGEGLRTRTGAVMGTPTYMSPEQCRGSGTIDRRTDIYSLGCILYELLCGRPPFVAEGAGDVIAHHLYFQPTAPRQVDPRIPAGIESLVLSLLQKDPAQRPASAEQLVAAIDQLGLVTATGRTPSGALGAPDAVTLHSVSPTTLSGAASTLSVATPGGRRRTWAVIAIVSAAVLGVVVAVVVASSRSDPESPSPRAAASPPADAAARPVPDAALAPVVDASAVRPSAAIDAAPSPPVDAAVEEPPPATARKRTKDPDVEKKSSAPDRSTGKVKAKAPEETTASCKRSSFSAVLTASQPDEKTVQEALARLKKCKGVLPADVYATIQRELISRL